MGYFAEMEFGTLWDILSALKIGSEKFINFVDTLPVDVNQLQKVFNAICARFECTELAEKLECKSAIEYLLHRGVNIQAEDNLCVSTACHSGNYEIVRLLMSLGAKIPEQCDYLLSCAAYREHSDLAQLLLDNGAKINTRAEPIIKRCCQEGSLKILEIVFRHLDINFQTSSGTAIEIAIRVRRPDVVKFLLRRGAKLLSLVDVEQKMSDIIYSWEVYHSPVFDFSHETLGAVNVRLTKSTNLFDILDPFVPGDMERIVTLHLAGVDLSKQRFFDVFDDMIRNHVAEIRMALSTFLVRDLISVVFYFL